MNSISRYQLAAMAVIADIFSLFCIGGSISAATLRGMLLAAVLQFLAFLVFASGGGKLSKTKKLFFLIYIVFCGGTVFSSLWRTSGAVYIPYEERNGIWGRLLTAGLIALVCLYSSSTGIRAVSRAALIAAAVGVICIVTDFASALFNADWKNALLPDEENGFYELARGFALSGGLGSFFVLSEKVRGDRCHAAVVYFAVKAALTVMVLLTALAVTGGIMCVVEFPVITAAQLSQPFEAQRIDSLFLVVFSVFAVFAAALQVMAAAYLLKELFPRFKRFRSTAVIILVLTAALLMSARELILPRAAAAIFAILAAAIKNPLKKQRI